MNPTVLKQLRAVQASLKTVAPELRVEFQRDVVGGVFIHPLAREMAADARRFGRHGPRLAKTIRPLGNQLAIGSIKEPTWAGAAFGGQRFTAVENRKRNQTMTWSNKQGRPKTRRVIQRRQTMQFLPHQRRRGWLIFPTWRRVDKQLTANLVAAIDAFLEERL